MTFPYPISILIGVYYALFGLAIGSFLNVYIYRTPLKLSVVKGHSFCPKCNHKLGVLDLVPIFSWIFLRGKCRYCKAPISPRYLIVEAMTSIVYLLTYMVFGFGSQSIILCLFFSMLIVLTFIDLDHGIVLDRINAAIIILGIISIFIPMLTNEKSFMGLTLLDRIIGLFAVSIPLILVLMISIYVFKKEGMGGGDIKLFAACGFFMGWKLILFTLLTASIVGSVFGIIFMIIASKYSDEKSDKETNEEIDDSDGEDDEENNPGFPFVPSIAIGCFLAVMFGNQMINWYINTFFNI